MAENSSLLRLLDIMARLRSVDGGCPWARAQNFASIAPYTIEEAHEVADAIIRDDTDALCDELGDLLFQIVFHAQLAEERGMFNFDAVAHKAVDKMQHRHPHVFGDSDAPSTPEAARVQWNAIKSRERNDASGNGQSPSLMDDVPPALPALTRAVKLQQQAARVGFDWDASPDALQLILDKLTEEIDELRSELDAPIRALHRIQDEFGDVFFVLANLARHLGISPESAAASGNDKFSYRFKWMEEHVKAKGESLATMSSDALDALWHAAKRATSGHDS